MKPTIMTVKPVDPAVQLANYIGSLPGFALLDPGPPYDHIGAVICDAGLQAGVHYKAVVQPRIERLLHEHPEAATTSAFRALIEATGPATLLNWQGQKKLMLIGSLVELFAGDGIETVVDLRAWLELDDTRERLLQVSGVGPKTVDYIRSLVGLPGFAIDVHLDGILTKAGLDAANYAAARQLYMRAAEIMGVDPLVLDFSIWSYASTMKVSGPPS
jgi:hypothetical protein